MGLLKPIGVVGLSSPLTADLDFATYKAVAMATDGGATLPTSPAPVEGQLFRHTPTGRKVLMMYADGAWVPQWNYAAATMYVDPTGSDSQNKGYGTGTNAFLTVQFAKNQIAGAVSGNVITYVAAGTYAEQVTIQGKNFTGPYTITTVGAMTTDVTGTATSAGVFSGGGASAHTKAQLTDTSKSWTASVYKGKLLVITGGTGSGQERHIYDNTATRLDIAGDWITTPDATSTYAIKSYGAIISGSNTRTSCFTITAQKGLIFTNIKATDGLTYDYFITNGSFVTFNGCHNENTIASKASHNSIYCLNSMIDINTVYIKYVTTATVSTTAVHVEGIAIPMPYGIMNYWSNEAGIGLNVKVGSIAAAFFIMENHPNYGIRSEVLGHANIIRKDYPVTGLVTANSVISGCAYGIFCADKGIARTFGGVEVNGSTLHGIFTLRQSMYFCYGATRISNNGGWGVSSSQQSGGYGVSGATYSGNTSGSYTADATSLNT